MAASTDPAAIERPVPGPAPGWAREPSDRRLTEIILAAAGVVHRRNVEQDTEVPGITRVSTVLDDLMCGEERVAYDICLALAVRATLPASTTVALSANL